VTGPCIYCSTAEAPERVPGSAQPSHVCRGCWRILQDPKTALPFLRGHLTLQLRGTVPEHELEGRINAFMGRVSAWRRPG